jgi:hypothetical protein
MVLQVVWGTLSSYINNIYKNSTKILNAGK